MSGTITLIRELRGRVCRCGQTKRPMQTFCSHCYFSLPKAMQSALYRRVGEGYEQAYADAAESLGEPQTHE